MLHQMLRAARLDRRFFTELIFDDYATGNSVLVVGAVFAIIAVASGFSGFSGIGVTGLLLLVLGGIIGWLVLAGALWLGGVKLLNGQARGQTVVRLVGFAHVPLIVVAAGLPFPSPINAVIALAGFVWFLAALVSVTRVLFDFDLTHALSATLLAVAVWWALQWIGLGPDLRVVLAAL
jgi:hypothetical protein